MDCSNVQGMDDRARQAARDEIAKLESSNRQIQYDLRQKEGLLPGYPADKRAGLENEIRGLRLAISANEQRVRDFQRQL